MVGGEMAVGRIDWHPYYCHRLTVVMTLVHTIKMADFEQVESYVDVLEDKKLAIGDRLNKRLEARNVEIQKKKEDNDTFSRQQSVQAFIETVSKKRKEIEDEVVRSNTVDKTKLTEHFDSLSDNLHKIQRYVSECTAFLPSYEVRQAQDMIAELQNIIQEKREELLPKKKFTFSKPKKMAEKKSELVTINSETDELPGDPNETELAVDLADCRFIKETGKTLIKQSSDINQKDVALVDLTDCTVKLMGTPSAIHVFNLKNCRIFTGPVSGSVFIRSCTGCFFVLACQQLRIHNTYRTDFYIHVTSKAIIEDCFQLKFAPYNWTYNTLDDDYKVSCLDRNRNNWDKVDDFNFLAVNSPSPNWCVIDESERVVNWD